jgi:hypothetical protein
MARTTLESLVLGGIRVKAGVKTMLVREGSKRGHDQTSASMSHPRHLSPSWPMDHDQTDSRCDLFDEGAAIRAGRSVSSAGVPVCPAGAAHEVSGRSGRTIRARWSLAEGGPCSTAVRVVAASFQLADTLGKLKTCPHGVTSAANEQPAYCVGGSVLARFSPFAADGMKQMPAKQARGKTGLAWPMPMPAMPSASTRGA